MNERIKELIKQHGINITIDGLGYGEGNVERLAELIVRECATTAAMFSMENKRIHPDIDPRDMPEANQMVYHSTCQSVAYAIKEHFGVEE